MVSSKLWLRLLLILISVGMAALATPPSVEPRSKAERKKLESLRYEKGLEGSALDDRLTRNLDRDCDGHAYASQDVDLMVGPVAGTYPGEVIEAYLKKHSDVCPSVMHGVLVALEKKNEGERARRLGAHYLGAYSGFERYRWDSQMWNIIPVLRLLGCKTGATKAFSHVYCGYSGQQPLPKILKEYQSRCPTFQLSCSANPQN